MPHGPKRMATRRTAAPPPTPAATQALDELPDERPPGADALSVLMDELAGVGTGSVTVYRAGRNQQLGYLFKCSPEAFSLDELRDVHGGGEFRVFVTRDG